MRYVPRPYQTRTTDFVISHKRCALWQQMGLGKTAAVLAAFKELHWSNEVQRALVVAPVRVAQTTWPDEIAKWDEFNELDYTVIKGTPKQRLKLLNDGKALHLINPELLPWLVEHVGPENFPYDFLIIDEPKGVRRPSSRGFKTLRKIMKVVDRMVQMTGTPAPNGLNGLWGPAYLLDGGRRLGTTRSAFLQRWFMTGRDGFSELARPHANKEIRERMADITVAMKTEDYLTLPPLLLHSRQVQLEPEAYESYRQLEREMFLHLDADRTAEAFNAAALTNKCLQCSNGAVYLTGELGEPLKDFEVIHDAKLDELDEIIHAANGSPVLVAYNFRSDLERILKRHPSARILDKDPSVISEWNRGEIDLLLAHPAAAGHGLNLQDGGNILVWFGLTWNLEHYEQMNKRLHRSGQSEPVTVYHLIAEHTLDEEVMERLTKKAKIQDLLFARRERAYA